MNIIVSKGYADLNISTKSGVLYLMLTDFYTSTAVK